MLQAYFDDSGSDGKQVGFVLAGYVLPDQLWTKFTDDWREECQRPPRISYFKMAEAAAGLGQFLSVPIEFRQYKVRNLLELIDRHKLHGITTNLHWQDFKNFNAGLVGPAKNIPYGPLFFGILDNILAYQHAIGWFPHPIQVDFDDQGGAGRFAIQYFGVLMTLAEQYGDSQQAFATIKTLHQIIQGTPRMLDDKEHVPLQAADMLAWSLRLQMEPSSVVQHNPFAWLYEDIRKTVWPGCMRFGKKTWEAIASQLPPPPDA